MSGVPAPSPGASARGPIAPEPPRKCCLEEKIIRRICQPALERVPRSIHPNALSLATHVICWLTAALAYLSARLTRVGRLLFLVGAGVGMFASMVGDCLDGMQARRTNRCSKLGEMMDHWLDSMAVPLVTLGITSALQLAPWVAVAVHVTNTMIYNAQLVLYHHTKKFVHPDNTTGVEAQLGVSFGYVGMGLFFFFFDRSARWVDVLLLVAGLMATLCHLRLNWFYYARLKRLVIYHLPFVAFAGGIGALYLLGAMDRLAFLLLIVFLSFRITGGYVQATLLGYRWSGLDLPTAFAILLMVGLHLRLAPSQVWGVSTGPVLPILPYVICGYLAVRTLGEFAVRFRDLCPARTARVA